MQSMCMRGKKSFKILECPKSRLVLFRPFKYTEGLAARGSMKEIEISKYPRKPPKYFLSWIIYLVPTNGIEVK